jgi:hypothetical protein
MKVSHDDLFNPTGLKSYATSPTLTIVTIKQQQKSFLELTEIVQLVPQAPLLLKPTYRQIMRPQSGKNKFLKRGVNKNAGYKGSKRELKTYRNLQMQ